MRGGAEHGEGMAAGFCFEAGGLEWLGSVVGGRGPARSLTAEAEAAIAADTLYEQPPDGSACWSTRRCQLVCVRRGGGHVRRLGVAVGSGWLAG